VYNNLAKRYNYANFGIKKSTKYSEIQCHLVYRI